MRRKLSELLEWHDHLRTIYETIYSPKVFAVLAVKRFVLSKVVLCNVEAVCIARRRIVPG